MEKKFRIIGIPFFFFGIMGIFTLFRLSIRNCRNKAITRTSQISSQLSLDISHSHRPHYFSHSEAIHLSSQSTLLFTPPATHPASVLFIDSWGRSLWPFLLQLCRPGTETSQGNAKSWGLWCTLSTHRISILVGFSCRAFILHLWKVLMCMLYNSYS